MHIICERDALLEVVSNVQRAVSVKNLSPVAEGILLRASGDSLYLAAYDMDLLAMTTTIPAAVKKPGQVVLSAKLFAEIVRRMSGESISIEADEKNNTLIRSDMAEFTIMGLPADEFPELPHPQEASTISIAQAVLKGMIRQTIFAIAPPEDPRPVHTGTKFEIDNGAIRLISVDGARLALRQEPIAELGEHEFIVPRKALQEVLKLLADEDQTVALTVGRRHIIFEINGYNVISRLLEGDFLPYQKALIGDVVTTVRINSRRLTDAVERASLVVNDRVKSPLVCNFHDGIIHLTCSTPLGSVNDKLGANIEGPDQNIGFNSRLMLDALKNCETDEIRIELGGTNAPMKILPAEGDAFLFLVLPMRMK